MRTQNLVLAPRPTQSMKEEGGRGKEKKSISKEEKIESIKKEKKKERKKKIRREGKLKCGKAEDESNGRI